VSFPAYFEKDRSVDPSGVSLPKVAVAFAGSAMAQTACGDRDKIVGQLASKYKETHRASGLETDTKMVEIWTSEASGSWTILITQANGQTCVAAAGKNWLDMPASDIKLGQAS